MANDELIKVRRHIMYLVGGVWLASFVADISLATYQPSPFIHTAMMAVLGALFGNEVLGRNGGNS